MMNNISNKAERAVELFSGGFNCSQAVLTAYASDFSLSAARFERQRFLLKLSSRSNDHVLLL